MASKKFYIPENDIIITDRSYIPEEDTPRIDKHLINLPKLPFPTGSRAGGSRTPSHPESSDGGCFEEDFIYSGCLRAQD